MEGIKLTAGVYDQLEVMTTMCVDGKTPGEPVIEIRLEEPTTHDFIIHRLYTSNNAWEKVTEETLKNGYGLDPASIDYALVSYFNNKSNTLIGKVVGPVIVKEETYLNDKGETKVTFKVARIGEWVPKGLIDATNYANIDQSLAARLGKKKTSKAAGAVAAPVAATSSATGTDDSVPF